MLWISNGKQAHLGPENQTRAIETGLSLLKNQAGTVRTVWEGDGKDAFPGLPAANRGPGTEHVDRREEKGQAQRLGKKDEVVAPGRRGERGV